MTWSNTTCPRADIAGRIPDFPVERLARDGGEMVVVRGSHPIYDCLPCQRLQFRFDMKERAVKTRWSTAIDGVVRAAEYTLRQESSNRFVTKYR